MIPAFFALLLACAARAEDPTPTDIAVVQAEMEAMRAELEALRAELEAERGAEALGYVGPEATAEELRTLELMKQYNVPHDVRKRTYIERMGRRIAAEGGVVPPLGDRREYLERQLDALQADNRDGPSPAAYAMSVVPPELGERVSYGSDVYVPVGESVKDAVSFGADVHVDGRVRGDATSFGGSVYVGPTAVIDGDAVSFGGGVRVAPGGIVGGDRVGMRIPLGAASIAGEFAAPPPDLVEADDGGGFLGGLTRRLVLVLSMAGAGVMMVGLFPARVGRIAASLEDRPVRAAFVGTFATGFVGLFSVLFAVLTLGLGLPVSLVLMGALGVAWLLGFVGLCQAVGDRLPFEQKPHGRWVAFLVGVLLVSCLGSLPWLGWVVMGAASVVGIGAALSTRFGGRSA